MPYDPKQSAQLVANRGWDARILAFEYAPLVTCFAVISQRYVVLIDTMLNPATAQVMVDHVETYLAADRQLLVINTHSDWDHVWGNQLFSGPTASYPAPIIASHACAADFGLPAYAAYLHEQQAADPAIFGEVVAVAPTITFADSMTIDGGDLTFQLLMAPGHTHDQIVIWVPEIRTLFAADSAERPYPAARQPQSMAQMRQTLAMLLTFDASVVLCCHADDIDDAVIRDNIAYFDYIEQCCRAAIANDIVLPDDDDADVAALIGCRYEDAMAADVARASYRDFYKQAGHAAQIRAVWQQVVAGLW